MFLDTYLSNSVNDAPHNPGGKQAMTLGESWAERVRNMRVVCSPTGLEPPCSPQTGTRIRSFQKASRKR